MRVVLDTNVLVSGLLSPFGASAQLVRWVASGDLALCHDPQILHEYEEVLLRPKFSFDRERVASLLEQIRAGGLLVTSLPIETSLPDRSDEVFLAAALAGKARCLITGNLKHYPSGKRAGMRVVSPKQFVSSYRREVGSNRR